MYYIDLFGDHIEGFAKDPKTGEPKAWKDADDALHEALRIWSIEKTGKGLGADTIQVLKPLGNDEYQVIGTYLTSEEY